MLRFILYRTILAEGFTIGKLFVQEDDDREPAFYCWTLEPQVRDHKIWGVTAVPEGTYKIVMRHSDSFGQQMPYLEDVPDFKGIMIHPGNTKKDTKGCILVGSLLSAQNGVLEKSRDAFDRIAKLITRHYRQMEDVTITIGHRSYH